MDAVKTRILTAMYLPSARTSIARAVTLMVDPAWSKTAMESISLGMYSKITLPKAA
ncbi:hypothetical protein D3C73_976670 [compost metagenome]